jgi:hypothetical protein
MAEEQWTEAQIDNFIWTYADPEFSEEGACRLWLERVPEASRAHVLARIDATLQVLRADAERRGPSPGDASPTEAVNDLRLKIEWARGVLGRRPD